MERYVAFLRGMNVGGHRVTSAEFRAHFAQLGFEDVATFRTSGNVIFSADGGEAPSAVAAHVEAGLAATLGYDVPVFLRTVDAVRAIAAHQPFAADVVAASAGRLQVMLLASAPTAAARKAVLAHASDEDRLAIRDRELYWLPSGGILDSPLDLKAIAAELGAGTVRTKGTIELIAAKHCAS